MKATRKFYVSPKRMATLVKQAMIPSAKVDCTINFLEDKSMYEVTLTSQENYYESVLNDLRAILMQEEDVVIQDSIQVAIHSLETLLDMGVYF